MHTFWHKLPRPFFALAPMADVTDSAYRRLIAEIAPPDIMWTEFVSADGLYATRERKKMADAENPLVRDLRYTEKERPVVAQLFSSNPGTMAYAAELCAKLGYDGIDINMGCPDSSIEKQGCGAAMIKSPETAQKIIAAAKDGAARGIAGGLPVSVKTRIGYSGDELDTWLPALFEAAPAALTVHLRTRKEMSKVAAHWDLMPRVVALRDRYAPGTPVLGNGDVISLEDARAKAAETGADGIMLGRAIFGNPWLFTGRAASEIPPQERLAALALLARYFEDIRPQKSFHILKKHIKAFVTGWEGAAELRAKLMECENADQLAAAVASADLVY